MYPWNDGRTARRAAFALAVLGPCVPASAQIIENVELRAEGSQAVLAVRFTTPVRYLRAVSALTRDLVQAFYEVTPTRVPVTPLDGQRNIVRGFDGFPTITVTDERDVGLQARKLVIRLDAPARYSVRAGRTNRIIELVLDDLGPAVRAVAERSPPPPAELPKRYVVVLQRASDPIRMEQPLPGSLSGVELHNVARVVEGRTEYELTIGPFDSLAQARAALQQLRGYPDATVAEVRATDAANAVPSAPTAPAAAPPSADLALRGRELLAAAKAAQSRGDDAAALVALEALLELPPNPATRDAQATIGELRQRLGDTRRARAEFETFLKLYPAGADSQRVRERLAALPADVAEPPAPTKPASSTVWTASLSQTYYGGQSQTKTLLKDTPLEGQIPQVVSDSTISGTDQKQLISSVDVGWRYRDTDQDIRFSFRDQFSADFMPNRADKNKLTALYLDYRQIASGLSARLGRQSGLGGGVLGRFDGALLGWAFKPKWRLNTVLGVPTDKLLDAKRHFYGVSLDGDGVLLPQVGGSLYAIEQKIDGQVDRRAIGNELRYVKPNATVFTVLEYDIALKGLNVASAQGLFTTEANSSFNLLYDRRSTPLLMLGNALFFAQPNGELARRITDLLGFQTLDAARRYVVSTTAYMTQASASFTTPITARWQAGMDLRLTNVGALAPVPDIPELVNGRVGTGNLWTLGAQAIGSNLYSPRDTHVLMVSAVSGPSLKGLLASYDNLSVIRENWQLGPSLRFYQQRQQIATGTVRTTRVVSQVVSPRPCHVVL